MFAYTQEQARKRSEYKLAYMTDSDREQIRTEQRIDKLLAKTLERERKQRSKQLRRKRKATEKADAVSYSAHPLQFFQHKQLMRGSDGRYYWMDKATFAMTPTTLTAALDEMETVEG